MKNTTLSGTLKLSTWFKTVNGSVLAVELYLKTTPFSKKHKMSLLWG